MKIIAVIGPGACDADTFATAEEVGRRIAERGGAVICGGLSGVMEAACRGAKFAGGTTIGVLPGDSASDANRWVDFPIVTGLSEARNVIIVRSAHAVIAVVGEYGTLSEIALALKLNIPVIGLGTWELRRRGETDPGLRLAENAADAVAKAFSFAG